MSWIAAISAALGIFASVIDYLKERKLIDGAIAEIVATNLQAAINEIRTANKVRDDVRADIAAHPDKLREPDINSRT